MSNLIINYFDFTMFLAIIFFLNFNLIYFIFSPSDSFKIFNLILFWICFLRNLIC